MKQRVFAIVGAIALVVIAVVAKGALRGEENGVVKPHRTKAVIACTPDLADVCDQLAAAGTIAEDPPTLELDGASQPPKAIDGWITWDPAPRVANFRAGTSGPEVWAPAEAIGSADLALLVPAGPAATCRTKSTFTCLLADPALTGIESIGLGSPATAEGLARILPLAKALDRDGTNTVATSTLQNLVDGRQSPQAGQADAPTQVNTLAVQGPAAVGAVVGPLPLLTATTKTPRGASLQAWSLRPPTTITVVFAARQGTDQGDLADQIRQDGATALETHGMGGDPAALVDDDLAGFLYQVSQKVG